MAPVMRIHTGNRQFSTKKGNMTELDVFTTTIGRIEYQIILVDCVSALCAISVARNSDCIYITLSLLTDSYLTYIFIPVLIIQFNSI